METTTPQNGQTGTEPVQPEMIRLTFDQFIDQYKPVKNHLDKYASFNGCAFETYGRELVHTVTTSQFNPDKVWTWDHNNVITNGFHVANRLGYLITEVPAKPNAVYEITDDESDDSPQDES